MNSNNSINTQPKRGKRRRRFTSSTVSNTSKSSMSWALLSLLALSHENSNSNISNSSTVSAFAPGITTSPHIYNVDHAAQTSIAFRNIDEDDDNHHHHHNGSSTSTGQTSTTRGASAVADNDSSSYTNQNRNRAVPDPSSNASYLESLYAVPATTSSITAHFNNLSGATLLSGSGLTGSVETDYKKRMPTWLQSPANGYLSEGKLTALSLTLRESSLKLGLTKLEVQKVVAAVKEASGGNCDMMAGTCDFLLLLMETMEDVMGVETLIAAAFHYCECYSARVAEGDTDPSRSGVLNGKNGTSCDFPPVSVEGSSNPASFSHLNYWDCAKTAEDSEIIHGHYSYLNSRALKIGQDAHQLIQDTARIKRAEMVTYGYGLSSNKVTSGTRPSSTEAENGRKMLLSETRDWRALAIRSAACLYRLRGINDHYHAIKENGDGEKAAISPMDMRVAREAICIHAPLASRLGMHRLKNEMEGAAFQILYKRQYEKVTSMIQQQKPCCIESAEHHGDDDTCCIVSNLHEGMRLTLSKVTREVEELLQTDEKFSSLVDTTDPSAFKVSARIKEPYSLWKKMLKNKADHILDIPDALALRVVFDAKKMSPDENEEVTKATERALCYYVQQACMTKFKPVGSLSSTGPGSVNNNSETQVPVQGRFKDYIARPKPNGYQSLHYSAFTSFEGDSDDFHWPFEIQVRSGEMHQVAEYGLAAHWDYKGGAKKKAQMDEMAAHSGAKSPHYAFKLDRSSDAYLRSVQDWHWQQTGSAGNANGFGETLTPYLEKLMKDQSNLAREHVFVFLSNNCGQSQILELPAGACVLDALRAESVSTSAAPVRVVTCALDDQVVQHNGVITPVTQKLSNGDIITVTSSECNMAISP